MLISSLEPENLSDDQMRTLLFRGISDDHHSGDCIFVPGSSKAVQYRLPKAVQLYQEGRASKILFSGGVIWEGESDPEAILLKQEAIRLGVKEQDILIEDNSLHTKENVLASLLVLDRAFNLHEIERLILVSTHYHMRRLHLTFKTYMPNWIDYTLCPANDRNTREDNWNLSEIGLGRVKTESEKLIRYVKQGVLEDAVIDLLS
ncbi:YdcF family protein [Ornithinibacillus xuwenensis]|uniref:YdcF family protein n=1 Tax=Ornithinibacillus xuwenensis TaxID=3144668 RepID=A0ABU9XFT7_9BACI